MEVLWNDQVKLGMDSTDSLNYSEWSIFKKEKSEMRHSWERIDSGLCIMNMVDDDYVNDHKN